VTCSQPVAFASSLPQRYPGDKRPQMSPAAARAPDRRLSPGPRSATEPPAWMAGSQAQPAPGQEAPPHCPPGRWALKPSLHTGQEPPPNRPPGRRALRLSLHPAKNRHPTARLDGGLSGSACTPAKKRHPTARLDGGLSGPACTGHEGGAGVKSVAVLAERVVDPMHVGLRQHARAAKFPLPLRRQADLKVARAGAAMLHLAGGSDPETLLDTLALA